jgi:short-chain fatty acids transporter
VSRGLELLADVASTNRGAVVLMGLVSMAASWLHWGLGLIAGPIFLGFLVRRHPRIDYRLAVAASYLGSTCTWHAGLSGSAPLIMATPKNFMEAQAGLVPVSMTTFSWFNLTLTAAVVAVMTLALRRLYPREADVRTTDEVLGGSRNSLETVDPHGGAPQAGRPSGLARALEDRYVINLVIGLLGVTAFWTLYAESGYRMSINLLNFVFLFAALLLHASPASFTAAAMQGATHLHGIVIQFPFYAGMYGLIRYSGLAEIIGGWFVSIASAKTFPVFIYWYSGILSYFIPSGGSKWAIEAPYVVAAAQSLGVPLPQAILAYAWGDMSTHFLQPFWAIPLLAIARVEFKDIVGYLALLFLVNLAVVSAAFALKPYVF